MIELTEKLTEMYSKKNPARLWRKVNNLDDARMREIRNSKNNGPALPSHRESYYSHRLFVLETILREKGYEVDDVPAFNYSNLSKYYE